MARPKRQFTDDICPECKNYRIRNTEYCICGHKWRMGPIEALFSGLDPETRQKAEKICYGR